MANMADASGSPRSPQDCDRAFGQRVNAGDLDGLVALYERSAALVRADRTAAIGHEAIAEDLAGFLRLRPRITMNVKQVFSGGDDVAVLYNDWHVTATDPDGKQIEFGGRAIEVVRRQPDGTWRFIIDDPYARDAS